MRRIPKADNTLIIPSNLSDAASFVASAMPVLERTKSGVDAQRAAKGLGQRHGPYNLIRDIPCIR